MTLSAHRLSESPHLRKGVVPMASIHLEQKVKWLEGQMMELKAREDKDRGDIGKLEARMDELTEFAHKTEALRRETPTEAPPDAIS